MNVEQIRMSPRFEAQFVTRGLGKAIVFAQVLSFHTLSVLLLCIGRIGMIEQWSGAG